MSAEAPASPTDASGDSGSVDQGSSSGDDASLTDQAQSQAPSPTPVEDLAPVAAVDEVVVESPKDELAEPFVQVYAEALSTPEAPDQDALVTVAAGPALQELQALVQEFDDNGWSMVGTPEVVSSTVVSVDAEADPPSAVIEVCLDSSGVDVVDSSGTSQLDERAPQRALNIFTMDLVEGRWVLRERTFPVQTACGMEP